MSALDSIVMVVASVGISVAYAHLVFNTGVAAIFLSFLTRTHDMLVRLSGSRLGNST